MLGGSGPPALAPCESGRHCGGSGPWEQGLLGPAHARCPPVRLRLAPRKGSRPLTLVPWACARFSACPGHPWVSTLPRASQKEPLSPREGLLMVSAPPPPTPAAGVAVQASFTELGHPMPEPPHLSQGESRCSGPLRGLEGVPGLHGAPQDEAGLPRKFETSSVAGAPC